MRSTRLIAGAFVLASMCFGPRAAATDDGARPEVRGRAAFVELQCHACHRVAEDESLPAGSKHAQGPVLQRLGERTPDEVKERIVSLTENDPEAIYDAPMTECASAITRRQLDDVVAYLRNAASGRAR